MPWMTRKTAWARAASPLQFTTPRETLSRRSASAARSPKWKRLNWCASSRPSRRPRGAFPGSSCALARPGLPEGRWFGAPNSSCSRPSVGYRRRRRRDGIGADSGDVFFHLRRHEANQRDVPILDDDVDRRYCLQGILLQRGVAVNSAVERAPQAVVVGGERQDLDVVHDLRDAFDALNGGFRIRLQRWTHHLSRECDDIVLDGELEIVKHGIVRKQNQLMAHLPGELFFRLRFARALLLLLRLRVDRNSAGKRNEEHHQQGPKNRLAHCRLLSVEPARSVVLVGSAVSLPHTRVFRASVSIHKPGAGGSLRLRRAAITLPC